MATAKVLVPLLALAIMVAGCGDKQSPAARRGEALYKQYCQTCHGGATGGSLKDVPPPHNANGHTWHHADQLITTIVLDGLSGSVDRPTMPPFRDRLAEQDVRDIIAFLETWWTAKQRAFQDEVTKNWEQR